MRPYQYAKKYGIKRQTVYRWIREGKLKAKKVYVVVERLDVEDKKIK